MNRSSQVVPQPFTLAYAEAFDLTSAAGDDFRISVGFPISYPATDRTYPALYVLDADSWFCTALEVSRERGISGEISEIVVVGIGYPLGTDFPTFGSRRTYDFSTADWDPTSPLYQEAEGVMAALGQKLRIGGALALLELITEQVQPLVNERYRVDPADQALFGHSAGGNFVGQVLFRRPGAFAKYIAGSPGFIYNDWEVFQLEEAYAASHVDLPVTLYLGAGSGETQQLANGGIVSGTARLAETMQLRKYPGLRLTCEFFAGKTHATVVTEVLNRGLEICWPGTPFELNVERAEESYRDLSPD